MIFGKKMGARREFGGRASWRGVGARLARFTPVKKTGHVPFRPCPPALPSGPVGLGFSMYIQRGCLALLTARSSSGPASCPEALRPRDLLNLAEEGSASRHEVVYGFSYPTPISLPARFCFYISGFQHDQTKLSHVHQIIALGISIPFVITDC